LNAKVPSGWERLWVLCGVVGAYQDKLMGHVNVTSNSRHLHLANDTSMAAMEEGVAKPNVDRSQSM